MDALTRRGLVNIVVRRRKCGKRAMSPERHYRWAFRAGLMALLSGVALVGWSFFGRTPNGEFRLAAWAGWLTASGVPNGVAHFLLWATALTFVGTCFGAAMAGFCRLVSAVCPACGGAARWDSVNTVAYRCEACGKRHNTGIGWGEELDAEPGAAPDRRGI
jgi:hypothetical protein